MRIVFMGTPDFAVPSLRAVVERHDVVAVYTQPDRPAGRGRATRSPAIKGLAHELGLEVRQPASLDLAEVARLREDAPDVICVAAFGQILPRDVLDIARFGAVNVHASLLPRHRGAAPVARAILEGDEVTGVSIMHVEEGLDTGPVALAIEVPVREHTLDSLTAALAEIGAVALTEVLDSIEDGSVSWNPQDEALATYAPKIGAADVALDPTLTVAAAMRRVRASSRRAPSRASVCGTTVVVLEATPAADVAPSPGCVATGDDLILGFADGGMRLVKLRPENRAEMSGSAFVCGLRKAESTWRAPA